MLPTHLRSPAKETRAKACLKKAFGLLFVTIQIHAKRKKGTGLLQDWSALGIEQAFPAYSASQAKRIFEGSQDIDILLTDIEMPRETGLQLVEWLHENDFHPIVLVLTGHQRFDYAQ